MKRPLSRTTKIGVTAAIAATGLVGAGLAANGASAADGTSTPTTAPAIVAEIQEAITTTAPATPDSPVVVGASDAGAANGADGDLECLELFAPPQEMIDALNAAATQLAAELDAAGIDYTMETDEFGIDFPAPADDDEAGWALVDDYLERHMDELFAGIGDMGFEDMGFEDGGFEDELVDFPVPEELREEIQADIDRLVAHLDEQGIAYTFETDDTGFSFPVPAADNEDEFMEAAAELFAFDEGLDHEFDGEMPMMDGMEGLSEDCIAELELLMEDCDEATTEQELDTDELD